MSVLENFKNIPRSPYGATGLKCNFFSSNLQRSPWRKKKGGLSPPQRATGGACRPPLGRPMGPAHRRDRGACRPPSGDRGLLPYISLIPPFPSHLSPKIPQKIQKKEMGEEKGSGEALPDSALVICKYVHLVYIIFYLVLCI